ncbi:MAG: LuxR C-terminal-related transcriptional regulator [Chloroflexi bacterium]|nr:LuxR C-terminal-related transcriptional regulator [Chloroflexota bacterium]
MDDLSRSGFRVLVEKEDIDAIRSLYEQRPDLVLIVTRLLGAPELKFVTQVRNLSDIPIFALGSDQGEVGVVDMLQAGADDCLPATVAIRELLARITANLRRSHADPQNLSSEGLWNQGGGGGLSGQGVDSTGEWVSLTPSEISFLRALVTERTQPSWQGEPERRGSTVVFESAQAKLTSYDPNGPLSSLTPRQIDVLSLMAQGLTNRGIAERLFISEKSVESYVNAIYQNLGVRAAGSVHPRVSAVLSYLMQPEN